MENRVSQFTVILADDETAVLEGLKKAVNWEELGISIAACVQTGQEALRAILENDPDFAVVDIRMPGLTGLEVIARAANAGVHTRFLILSGYDDFSYAKEAIRCGAKAYLLKPVDNAELHDELYRLCLEASKDGRGGAGKRYQEKLNKSFFTKLIDSKILEPGVIAQQLGALGLGLADSASYVFVILYENGKAPEDAATLLNGAFSGEKCVFRKYNSNQILGIFNASSKVAFGIAMECRECLRREGFGEPLVGVGDTVSGLMQVPYSYSRALTALTYRLYANTSGIFTYEIICNVAPSVRLSDIDYMPLVQYIVKKDLDGIHSYVGEFVERILYVPMPPPNFIFSICYALFHRIEEEFSSFSHQEITAVASAQDLYKFKKLEEIREWMVSSFTQLSEFIDAVYGYATSKYAAAQKTGEEDELIRDAKEFVHGNITKHLKIEDIARHVHLSPSYFAIYFKGKTGVNLRDYLLAEKMEYARKALTNPDTPISDVAYDVGYGDYRSFSRAFKNVHGITPSDFQARYRKDFMGGGNNK